MSVIKSGQILGGRMQFMLHMAVLTNNFSRTMDIQRPHSINMHHGTHTLWPSIWIFSRSRLRYIMIPFFFWIAKSVLVVRVELRRKCVSP